jgi:hypothetical protein
LTDFANSLFEIKDLETKADRYRRKSALTAVESYFAYNSFKLKDLADRFPLNL